MINNRSQDEFSPSSTLTDIATNAAAPPLRILGVESSKMAGGTGFMPYQGVDGTATHGVIRADASLVTCFDQGDKELYELWTGRG